MEPPSLCGRRRPWQDLPSELLGLVLLRIPSHASRVRLRSVCSPWRAAARMQSPLPPLLPWLALRDGAFLSLPDGELHHRVVVQDDHVAHRLSTGSMLFLVNSNEGCSLLNPLSREKTAPRIVNLQCLSTRPGILLEVDNIRKVVVVSDQVTAVRTGNKMYFTNLTILDRRSASSNLVCRWIPASHTYSDYILDIALFQEKLYVLATSGLGAYHLRLYVVDIIGDKPISINCVFSTPNQWETYGFPHYLVASGDRLLMVKQSWKVHTELPKQGSLFEVFEASDMSSDGGWWRKIDTLMGRALFLSEGCSESLPAAGDQCLGAQDDCIYFLSERNNCDERTGRLYSGIYNMKEGRVSPLPLETVADHGNPFTATWFFPDDT